MRQYAKVDANHVKIVTELRQMGCTVLSIAALKNCCDIIVGFRGKNFMFEIKDGNKPKSKKKLTEGEKKFFEEWKGQVKVIETAEQAMQTMDF